MLTEHLAGRADFGRWLWLVHVLRSWHGRQVALREVAA
jgi:hypothetical protein